MKKILRFVLVVLLLLTTLLTYTVPAFAAKTEIKRKIAIVFDNSGSMYVSGEKAWCRATYAMEVFASMLNKGDSLSIHPMNPIEINGKKYTMDSPFVISEPSKAHQIRNIYTEKAMDTHIETIDAAIKELESSKSTENYLIVLTDGQVFYENGEELTVSDTKAKLAERFSNNIGSDLKILYLGIGSSVAMPQVESEYYIGEKASDSKNVLSTLTMMCNNIFARDTLPQSHIIGNTINFDITMSKLIVFVQGENVSNVKVAGKNGAKAVSAGTTKTQFSSKGAGNFKKPGQSAVDSSLQGMLVTYTDCAAGEYEVTYSGNASSVEIYYEPDADLDFIFTDKNGNTVDPNALYKGEYKVQFGLKDAKTGKLVDSDLLGNPVYEGKYVINGKEYPIKHNGKSGEVLLSLNTGDEFTAELTASYLSGYSITKTAKDFGWPDGVLKITEKPIGDDKIEIKLEASQKHYEISKIDESESINAYITFNGKKLSIDEFNNLEFKADCGGIGYTVIPHPEESFYEIRLDSSEKVEKGRYNIKVSVTSKDEWDRVFKAEESCKIRLSNLPLWLEWLLAVLIILIILIILYIVLHIKRLPTKLHTNKRDCEMIISGEDMTKNTAFSAAVVSGILTAEAKFAGMKTGVKMAVRPGTDSFVKTKQVKRKAMVDALSVKKLGSATIENVSIGSRKYLLNEENFKLEPAVSGAKDFELSNGNAIVYSGNMQLNGVNETFYVRIKLNYRKN